MNEYKVKWDGSEKEMEVDADTSENAYLKFLEDAHPEEKPVVVTYLNDLDGKRITESFNDHLDGATPSFNERKKLESLEQKLDRLCKVMTHIRWIILVWGFIAALFFTGVLELKVIGLR